MNNSTNLMANLKNCLSGDNLKKITIVLKKLKGIKNASTDKTELNQVLDEIHQIFHIQWWLFHWHIVPYFVTPRIGITRGVNKPQR